MDTIEEVFRGTNTTLTRAALTAASFTALPDDEVENTQRAAAQLLRAVTALVALGAANIAARSDWTLGPNSLARRCGYASAKEMVQACSGGLLPDGPDPGGGPRSGGGGGISTADAGRLIDTGTLATQAHTSRARQEQADQHAQDHPNEPPLAPVTTPWHAPLGDALNSGVLGTETAMVLKRGLGDPAPGVTEDTLTAALVDLVTECATLNADQAAKAARHTRDRIDSDGVAARADAMRQRQYLRVFHKPDGMLHGDFDLDPENGALFDSFLLHVIGPRRGGPRFTSDDDKRRAQAIIDDPRPTDRIAVDALMDLIRRAGRIDPARFPTTRSPAVKAVFTRGTWPTGTTPTGTAPAGFLEDSGDAIPQSTIDRLICEGGITPVLFGPDNTPLNVGRTRRLFTTGQRVALTIRDGGCMWPGCEKPVSHTEAHHLDGYATGGATDITNGILFCRGDHLRLHNDSWQVRRTGHTFWLVPPEKVDPAQTPIALHSKANWAIE